MIKNVVFDNGGVIVKYSFKTYLDYFKYPKKIQNKLNTLFLTDEWIEFAKGKITSAQFKEFALEKFKEYKKEVLEILDVKNLKFLIPPYTQTIEFIKLLKSDGYNVYLLTDINEDTIDYLNEEIENFESMFDGIVYSCRVGMVKKEGKVFKNLLDKYNLEPTETLFVDDSLNNLKEAKKYNILTYKFLEPEKDIKKLQKIIYNN